MHLRRIRILERNCGRMGCVESRVSTVVIKELLHIMSNEVEADFFSVNFFFIT